MKSYLIFALLIFFSVSSHSAQLNDYILTAEPTLSNGPTVGIAGLSEPINFTSVITQLKAMTDGVVDSADAFPDDPSETTDTDGNGVGRAW